MSKERVISWFGKLPCVGDFSSHNMSQNWIDILDKWLSTALQQGLEKHGMAWTQAYFNTPIHGFVWDKNILPGLPQHMAVGLVMPSVDKAGRAFPFVLLEQLPHAALDQNSVFNWFAQAHTVCSTALEEEWHFGELNKALALLPAVQGFLTEEQADKEPSNGSGHWFRIDFDGQVEWTFDCAELPNATVFEKMLKLPPHHE